MMPRHYRERFAITIIIATCRCHIAPPWQAHPASARAFSEGLIDKEGIGGGDGGRQPERYRHDLDRKIIPVI